MVRPCECGQLQNKPIGCSREMDRKAPITGSEAPERGNILRLIPVVLSTAQWNTVPFKTKRTQSN
jgi:hypothetical protein